MNAAIQAEPPMPSPAVEDYLKTIFHLSSEGGTASTSAVAERLGVTAGSVTGMLKRLAEQGFVEHVPYYGARLTETGAERAIAIIRRHRILELFLVEVLGYSWDEVHDEAERLEHAATPRLVERMSEVLGRPESDPHGAPIPDAEGAFRELRYPSLAEIEAGERVILRRVSDEDPAALRYLAGMGLLPGTAIVLVEHAPFDGPVRIRVGGPDGAEQQLGRRFAATLQVERA
jgi:DtxR family Mn-dependent transcriptional regulator